MECSSRPSRADCIKPAGIVDLNSSAETKWSPEDASDLLRTEVSRWTTWESHENHTHGPPMTKRNIDLFSQMSKASWMKESRTKTYWLASELRPNTYIKWYWAVSQSTSWHHTMSQIHNTGILRANLKDQWTRHQNEYYTIKAEEGSNNSWWQTKASRISEHDIWLPMTDRPSIRQSLTIQRYIWESRCHEWATSLEISMEIRFRRWFLWRRSLRHRCTDGLSLLVDSNPNLIPHHLG